MKRGDMKINRLSILYSALFFIFISNYLFAQTETDKNNQTNLQVLEERIKQIEEKTEIRIDAIEKQINQYLWFFGAIIVIITLIFTVMGRKWIRQTAENYIQKEGKKEVDKLLLGLDIKGKEKIGELEKIRIDYENSLSIVKNKIKDIDMMKPLPEESKEDLDEFEDKLEQLKKEKEYSSEDWFYRGLSEYNKLHYETAITYWLNASKLEPRNEIVYNNIGLAFSFLKKYKESIENYNKSIELNPKYATAYNNRGVLYANLKDYKKSFEDYNKAIELNPEYADAYNNRGNLYLRLKKYKESIENYNKAIELNPKYDLAYNNRGALYTHLNKYKKAIDDFNKAIELNPKDEIYYRNISEAMIFTGAYKNALNYVNKAITLSSEMKDKAICFYLKSIIEKLLDLDTTESVKEFNKILENEFTIIGWEFDQMENWLKKADISEDKKRFITEKTEILKKKKE